MTTGATVHRLGITLLVADYRGYGSSGGVPTASSLLADSVAIFGQAGKFWEGCGLTPARLYVMGRSLAAPQPSKWPGRPGSGWQG